MFSMGVPKSLASITAAAPGASFSMSWPKNGPPKRPICRRGSGSLVRAIITNARPVMGPSCAEAGKEISKRGPAVCALAVVGIQNMPTAANRISAVRLNWIIVVPPQKKTWHRSFRFRNVPRASYAASVTDTTGSLSNLHARIPDTETVKPGCPEEFRALDNGNWRAYSAATLAGPFPHHYRIENQKSGTVPPREARATHVGRQVDYA